MTERPPIENTPRTGDARRVASGALSQQAAQVTGLAVLFAVVTLLARRLSVAELGTYGLTATLAVYLLLVKNSIGGAAQRAMVAATGERERVATFTTAAGLYAVAGLVTGVLIVLAGWVLATTLLTGDLRHQARLGTLILGLVTASGLAASVNLDALRASLLLTRSALNEIAGVLAFGALMLTLVLSGAPLWALIGASGSIPLFSGVVNLAARRRLGLEFRLRRGGFDRVTARELGPTAGWLLAIEGSTLVIYGFDRVVLGAFGSATDIGLYEGPVRAHNLIYALVQAVGVATLPAAAAYVAAGDSDRLRRLLLDGSRYTAALFVPLAVTAMVLAGPALEVWLGAEYRSGSTALTVLVSYWVVYGTLALIPNFLVGLGHGRQAARALLAIAALNLLLSVALTPSLGVEGPAVGTAVAYALGLPLLVPVALRATGVSLGELARAAWLPALGLGAVLAAALVAVRLALDLSSLAAVLVFLVAGPLAYWALYAAVVLDGAERRTLRGVVSSRAGR